ncbi:kinase-like protein [Rickenella mellea]|uniref:Kinase-like protein n=1 Tax=Rickenella mellea TaxID=50990 RepID=A0A4Y7PWP4_9AGAM|nr:kinase-like protein [Rickenella mellea]
MGFRNLWLRLPSFIRLRIYHILIKVGLRLYEPTGSHRCYKLPFNLYAKFGGNVFIAEADAMRYISSHTTAPVPSVVDAIPVPTGAFIVMTGLPGTEMFDRLQRMSTSELALLAQDLKASFEQIRSLPPPTSGPRVSGFGGGNFRCFRIDSDPIGPFATEGDFYQYIYEHAWATERERLEHIAQKVHSTPYKLCLTHNDLAPHNILLDGNNRLSGIVDWECCAWMPEYWEYTRSCYVRDGYTQWLHLMGEVFGTWPEELAVEKEFWYCNDPW